VYFLCAWSMLRGGSGGLHGRVSTDATTQRGGHYWVPGACGRLNGFQSPLVISFGPLLNPQHLPHPNHTLSPDIHR
jgi:hypothetical protein